GDRQPNGRRHRPRVERREGQRVPREPSTPAGCGDFAEIVHAATRLGPSAIPPAGFRLAGGELLMKQPGTRVFISVVLAISTLLAAQSVAYASGPSVSGGGIVDGPLGTTSQLGF